VDDVRGRPADWVRKGQA